jgi:PAS domain-containing protein
MRSWEKRTGIFSRRTSQTNIIRDDLRVMATREPIDTVEANQTPEGERIFVHVIKTPLYDSAGNVVGIQGIFWDVTERKKTEEAWLTNAICSARYSKTFPTGFISKT